MFCLPCRLKNAVQYVYLVDLSRLNTTMSVCVHGIVEIAATIAIGAAKTANSTNSIVHQSISIYFPVDTSVLQYLIPPYLRLQQSFWILFHLKSTPFPSTV